jgi:hypothetical protein
MPPIITTIIAIIAKVRIPDPPIIILSPPGQRMPLVPLSPVCPFSPIAPGRLFGTTVLGMLAWRRCTVPDVWTAEELAAATGEPVDRLAAFAQAGLLLRRADGRYEASITPPTG